MSKRDVAVSLSIIFLIFFLGFFLRVESTQLSGISPGEKVFYQDQNGLPYMYDMDSYYNYRLTRNYLDHGYLGDAMLNGSEWDLHSYYPPGLPMTYPPLLIYLTASFYEIINIFFNLPLMTACYWIPAFMAPLSGVVAYLFMRRQFTNDYGALAAGILVVTAPFYFMRTVPGWFDTDIFIILFPLLISWLLFEAIHTSKKKIMVYLTVISGFLTFLFSMAWEGWAYIFYIIVFSFLIYITISAFKKCKIKNIYQVFTIFLVSTLVLIVIFAGLSKIETLLFPLKFIEGTSFTIWPNIYSSISELQIPSLINLIFGLGPILLGLGVFGLIYIPFKLKKEQQHEQFSGRLSWFLYLFILTWFLIGLFSLTKGIRFILILIPPLVIISGVMIGFATDSLNFLNKKSLKKVLPLLIIILISLPSILVIYDNLSNLNPRMNDDMWNAGLWIQDNTNNDTVVISQWVYGHFFTAVSDRPVSIDGGTQNSPRSYWIYRAFSTSNETLSLGIFRMLATSGDAGYLTLNKYTENTTETVEILNNILGVDNNTAEGILIERYHLSGEQALNVLKYTHPSNSSSFVLVTYRGMINDGYWIFDLGEWNFKDLKGGNYIYSYGNIKTDTENLKSDDGVLMNIKTGNLTWNGVAPYCILTIQNGIIEKRYVNGNSSFCVILLLDDQKSVVIDKRFENSMFTKLVIEKSNSTIFKPAYENENVVVWKLA